MEETQTWRFVKRGETPFTMYIAPFKEGKEIANPVEVIAKPGHTMVGGFVFTKVMGTTPIKSFILPRGDAGKNILIDYRKHSHDIERLIHEVRIKDLGRDKAFPDTELYELKYMGQTAIVKRSHHSGGAELDFKGHRYTVPGYMGITGAKIFDPLHQPVRDPWVCNAFAAFAYHVSKGFIRNM